MNRFRLLTLIVLLLTGGCTPILYDGPYEGRVVDATTGEPIEGAVVAMSWYTWRPTVAGQVDTCYDSAETVTDSEGNFRIKGKGLRVFSRLDNPSYVVLKRGYWPIDHVYWGENEEKITPIFELHRIGTSISYEPKSILGIRCNENNLLEYNEELYAVEKIMELHHTGGK